jgi:uncharacterized protein (DUF1778 family)
VEPLAKVTAALARARPVITEELPIVIDTPARIVPMKVLDAPIVADEPTKIENKI